MYNTPSNFRLHKMNQKPLFIIPLFHKKPIYNFMTQGYTLGNLNKSKTKLLKIQFFLKSQVHKMDQTRAR